MAASATSPVDVKALHAKIGELTLANFFRARARRSRSVAERKAMIDRSHALPLARQAEELGISRGSLYYQPQLVSAADLRSSTTIKAANSPAMTSPACCSRMRLRSAWT